jgi:hypothetical protein
MAKITTNQPPEGCVTATQIARAAADNPSAA